MPRVIKKESDGFNKALPKRLRELMKERDGTHDELASVLGVQRQTVTNYCNGVSAPTWESLVLIADFFNVSVDYLLGRTDARGLNRPDIRAACDYTGLSEEAVNRLRYAGMKKLRDGYIFQESNQTAHDLLSRLFCSHHFLRFVSSLVMAIDLERFSNEPLSQTEARDVDNLTGKDLIRAEEILSRVRMVPMLATELVKPSISVAVDHVRLATYELFESSAFEPKYEDYEKEIQRVHQEIIERRDAKKNQ